MEAAELLRQKVEAVGAARLRDPNPFREWRAGILLPIFGVTLVGAT